MICNPVIAGGAEEKVYKITDKTGYISRTTAKAGEIIVVGQIDSTGIQLTLENGVKYEIPHSNSNPSREASGGTSMRIPIPFWFFVMPAQDVTISM